MRTGRPIAPLSVTEEQRSTLKSWAVGPNTAQALALRAKIILACAEGKPNSVVARQARVRQQTVGKWRSRFLNSGLNGLLDEPRPGTPRRVSRSANSQTLVGFPGRSGVNYGILKGKGERVDKVYTWRPRRSRFGANWCNGIPASTIGWKAAARSCI